MKHRVDICTESQDNIVSVGVHDLPWENLVLLENFVGFHYIRSKFIFCCCSNIQILVGHFI